MAHITQHAKLILHKSIELVKAHPRDLFTYVLALFVPVLIYSVLMSLVGQTLWANVLLSILLTIVQMWVGLALTKEIAERYEQKPNQPLEAQLKNTTSLIIPSIWISIISTLIILGGTLLLIIPGIIFSVWYMFGNVALVLDGKKGMAALKESKRLVRGRWWQVFFAAVLPTVAIVLLLILVDIVLNAIFGIINSILIIELISSFISYLMTPLFTAIFVILYIELQRSLIPPTPEV